MQKRVIGFGLAVLALVLVVGSGVSQDAKRGKIRPALPAGWRALGLSKDQIKKIYDIQIAHRTKIRELEEQIAELKAKERRESFSVLTEQQKKRLLGADAAPNGEKKKAPAKER